MLTYRKSLILKLQYLRRRKMNSQKTSAGPASKKLTGWQPKTLDWRKTYTLLSKSPVTMSDPMALFTLTTSYHAIGPPPILLLGSAFKPSSGISSPGLSGFGAYISFGLDKSVIA